MPWKETCAMDERAMLVEAALRGEASVAAVCRAGAVSRKTGYTWLGRYRARGREGLADLSRARRSAARGRTPRAPRHSLPWCLVNCFSVPVLSRAWLRRMRAWR